MKAMIRTTLCDIEFAQYDNGQTAIRLVCDDGEPYGVATVNLEALGAPIPAPGRVWLKTWSENDGIAEALEAAGVLQVTTDRFHCNHDAWAVQGLLTPAAQHELALQRGDA